ncbi:MAG: hypothetical protein LBT65_02485, partial [Synergistaceae bacterium]|nr:hypothetical protein [Synergistaceae bacterium]
MKKILLFALTLSVFFLAIFPLQASASPVVTRSPSGQTPSPAKNPLKEVFTISPSTLTTYAWVNEGQVAQPVKAIAIDIQGLNGGHGYRTTPESGDIALGKRNVLV